ncbi:response regulator transcription factor [Cryobacterium melibiosiphilum]|uniref:response regulator transcription factor n=1 Tax=Cryobacterium melibiosiphilum TaxID=995039 RepID=UPI001F39B6C4|nr:response regulator transcription factor [Cryobacterium melibiosiphilum]
MVIEDDPDVRELLESLLREAGFTVRVAANGFDGLGIIAQVEPMITTLDVTMPGMDGFETLRRIRAISSTRIIMISARSDETDVVLGLTAGADDYISKPFRTREVRARIESVLRRAAETSAGPVAVTPDTSSAVMRLAAPPEEWIEYGLLRLNPHDRLAQVGGIALALTRSEFELLAALFRARGRVCTKRELVMLLRTDTVMTSNIVLASDKRSMEVHIANLRRKMTHLPGSGAGPHSGAEMNGIETVRGIGYRLSASLGF